MQSTTIPHSRATANPFPVWETIRLAHIALSREEFLEWITAQVRNVKPRP